MILRTSKGRDYWSCYWPNNTPDERVELTEAEIKGNCVKILWRTRAACMDVIEYST
jgi:hypothetical protein